MPNPASRPRAAPPELAAGFRWGVRVGAVVLAGVLGCVPATSRSDATAPTPFTGERPVADRRLTVPGTYASGTACAAGPRTDISLTLYPDSLFVLRQTHRDQACDEEISFLYVGLWTVSRDGRGLTLLGEAASPRRFVVVDYRTLRAVEEPMPRADSVEPRQAERTVRLVPFREPFRLRGLMPT